MRPPELLNILSAATAVAAFMVPSASAGGGYAPLVDEDDTATAMDGLTTHHSEESHDSPHIHAPKVVVFIFGCCLLGAISRSILKKVPIPYTVVLLVLGALLGFTASNVPLVEQHTTDIAHMDPHVLLQIFLPILIFESAFAMDVHTFMRSFLQVCILAVFGLVVASVMTAILAMFLFNYNWNFSESMMFGSIMSATDPVAVVALLKDLGASKQLGTIIEGESLLNDGCAIVIFNVFMKIVFFPHLAKSAGENALYFLQVAIGGPLFGFGMAKITVFWLSHIFNDALVEITITLAATYLTYYIGDVWLGVSGVLAVVVLGLIVNAEKTSISPEVEVFLHRFWEMLAYLANTLIFMMVGVVVTQKALVSVENMDWFYLVGLYLAVNIIRGLVISFFSPILARIGYGLTWRNAVVMTWGGLRGAVGLALALVVETLAGEGDDIGDKFLFHTAGIVVLTLIINATTIQSLLGMLGMSDISIPKRLAMAGAVRRIQDGQKRTFNMLKSDRFLADADWDIAENVCHISDPYSSKKDDDDEVMDQLVMSERKSMCPGCRSMVPNEPTHKEFADMMEESRLRMLKAEKVSYWKQFEHGMLAREAVRLLVQHAEVAADGKDQFIMVSELKKSWQIRGIYPWLKRKLEDLISERKTAAIPMPKNRFAKLMYRLAHTTGFEVTINFAIFLNIIPIIMEFSYPDKESAAYLRILPYLRYSNFVFFAIYVLEAIIKIIGLRRYYVVSHWNKFDAFILLLSLVDILIAETLVTRFNFNVSALKMVKLFRLMRGLRMLRLTKVMIPRLIGVVNGRINRQLSLGYDVGKGFIIGEEEVSKLIDHMVDNKKILRELKHISDTGRLQVIKELGLLQRDHPGIAVSVKTRQAIRTILNHSRETIHELQGAGLLDEMEAHKLEKMVEVKMKRLMNAPSSIPPPPPENLLKNVSWLSGDTKLINFIKARASLLHYDYGDVIVREGDPSDGLFLIVSGLVKLFGRSAFLDHDNPRSSFSNEDDDQPFEDYLTVGNVIGEMGVLTNKPRNATVICETTVQVYFITAEDMQVAIDTFTLHPSLEYRLWRVVAIRIATPLIMAQMTYQGWTQEKVKLHLERGYLADLPEMRYSFNIDATMEDLILVNGNAINAHTREEIKGPCIIPRSVHKLNFQLDAEAEPRLFVVRTSDYNGPIVDGVVSHNDLHGGRSKISITNISSNMCLKHAAELRVQNSQVLLGSKSSKKSVAPLVLETNHNVSNHSVEVALSPAEAPMASPLPALAPTLAPSVAPPPKNFLPNLGLSMSVGQANEPEEMPMRSPPRTPLGTRLPPLEPLRADQRHNEQQEGESTTDFKPIVNI
ncbi:sperm-specific sodium:proton exchanger-like [Diadema antillarum]|uniref:sperm-specific sodium:proton exchanger-like n=1 Tax=Diadema antillarum TaxID=105358 RepID=UPI003A8A3C77